MLYSEGKPGCFSSTVYILPGTHHVRFLVDGIMQTSPDLPTTVDFGNNLVNYIEVSPEDALQGKKAATTAATASKPKPDTESEPPASRTSSGIAKDQPRTPKGKAVLPAKAYRAQVPQYLLDFDQVEESSAYKHAVSAIEKLPTPPSLPGFLGKPILNAATLLKDDNSVLNMPNHTVLNHLATSSIKNNVLAVSATTRYRDKVSLLMNTIIFQETWRLTSYLSTSRRSSTSRAAWTSHERGKRQTFSALVVVNGQACGYRGACMLGIGVLDEPDKGTGSGARDMGIISPLM